MARSCQSVRPTSKCSKSPVAIEVLGLSSKDRMSPSRTMWSECCRGGCKYSRSVGQMHSGCSDSAQRVAISLWLHRLSMTEGYLMKMALVEGD